MKSLFQRSMLALACAATLAACGGDDDGNLVLGGSVTGLEKTGLQLSNNGGPLLDVPAGAGSFAFKELIPSKSGYNVKIVRQPTGASCEPKDASGTAANYNVTTVRIICKTFQHQLGGTVSGLDANQFVTLVNAPEQLAGLGNGAFTFKQTVGEGNLYGVGVLASSVPDKKTCSVPNGAGTMPASDFSGLTVVCVPK